MKTRLIFAMAACTVLASGCAALKPDQKKAEDKPAATRLAFMPLTPLQVDKSTTVQAKLNNIESRDLITDDDLKLVHTKKFHLLVVDSTLTDYQHIHPQATSTRGVYSFEFTPKMDTGYRAWADITPVKTGKQEFASADLTPRKPGATLEKKTSMEAMVDGYHFKLSFDTPPVAGSESMGTITVTDKQGKPVKSLQPVMGAYAHIVGFYDDFHTVVHTHPMGEEPTSESDRGGPDMTFHIEPAKPGYIRIFAQYKINGRDVYAPFGIMVAKQ